jgi:hypothetical protein
MPAFGYKKFSIDLIDKEIPKTDKEASIIENDWYKIKINKEKGILEELFDKELNKHFIDPDASWGFGQLIHEKLDSRLELEQNYLKNYSRTPLDSVVYSGYTPGEVWNTIRFEGYNAETAYPNQSFSFEIRMYKYIKRIDFSYSMHKKPIIDPESIYVSFPFNLENAVMSADVPGGVMKIGIDQLPGSVTDWSTIQNYVSIKNQDCQIVLGSHETPLMQLGGINTGRFRPDGKPESMHIYGWPMNNYWTTNFNADQRGMFEWTYYFTSMSDTGNDAATRFGWESRISMPTLIIPAGINEQKKFQPDEVSLLSGIPENVLLVNAQSADNENCIILHIRETKGETTSFNLRMKEKDISCVETDVNGNPLSDPLTQIKLKPYQLSFLKFSW